jgi:hypothetical protein
LTKGNFYWERERERERETDEVGGWGLNMHDRCHIWSRNCLPFRRTWVHRPLLWVHVALSLVFCVVLLSFLFCHYNICPLIYPSYCSFGIFKLFLLKRELTVSACYWTSTCPLQIKRKIMEKPPYFTWCECGTFQTPETINLSS